MDYPQDKKRTNPLVDLALAQTAAMDAGKIGDARRNNPEPRCEVCGKLLVGDRQHRMGLCGAHMDEAF